MRAFAERQNL